MSIDGSGASAERRALLMFLKLAVSVALMAVLFWRIDARDLWHNARQASPVWLGVALALYAVSLAAATWRWRLLLGAQDVRLPGRMLFGSYLVAMFFNNFLPSNIGGDVVRIRDTAAHIGSKTIATMVVFVDRLLGLMGLVLVAALGATMAATVRNQAPSPIWPSWLWASFLAGAALTLPMLLAPGAVKRLLAPLDNLNSHWVGERVDTLTNALARFRERPSALAGCFTGAIAVQALLIVYYLAIVHALHMPITVWDLAVIVPISFVVQLLPISLNGFGVRETAFTLYFTRLHLPIQSAVLLSLAGAVLMMVFSLTGAAVYVSRGR
jgi:uncharacterized protein (TIRG00374 family)